MNTVLSMEIQLINEILAFIVFTAFNIFCLSPSKLFCYTLQFI